MLKALTPQKIEMMIHRINYGLTLLKELLDLGEGLVMALNERERLNKSLRQGVRALDWGEFLNDMHARQDGLGELLEAGKVRKFDMGRLWLEANGYAYTALSLYREQIRAELHRIYGAPFRVRIICEEK